MRNKKKHKKEFCAAQVSISELRNSAYDEDIRVMNEDEMAYNLYLFLGAKELKWSDYHYRRLVLLYIYIASLGGSFFLVSLLKSFYKPFELFVLWLLVALFITSGIIGVIGYYKNKKLQEETKDFIAFKGVYNEESFYDVKLYNIKNNNKAKIKNGDKIGMLINVDILKENSKGLKNVLFFKLTKY